MIAQTIQLSLAPVFVLVAIGNIFNILSLRLARVIDRSRHLQMIYAETTGKAHDAIVIELRQIDQRIHLVSRAILLLVLSGLSVGLTVMILFLSQIVGINLQNLTAAMFLVAIMLLMTALIYFLREIRLSTAQLRLPPELLEWEQEQRNR